MRKRTVILLIALLTVSASYVMAGSRDTLHTTYVVNTDFVPMHVVTASIGGGVHTLLPTLSDEGKNMTGLHTGIGGGVQIQALYSYYFYKYVAVTGGFGFDMYSGNMNGEFHDRVLRYYKDPDIVVPQIERTYWLNSDYKNFKESEQLYMITIPVGVTGRVNLTDPIQLRGTIGIGMNIVAGSNFRATGDLETTADFEETLNLHIDSDMPQHGFSNYYLGGYNGKIVNTFPVNMFVFGDFGVHYQLTRRYGVYGGLYVSYTCFNAIRPTTDYAGKRPELVTFDMQTKQFNYAGMLNSKFVDAIHPLSVGIKVGLTLTFLDPIKCNCENW